MTEEEKQQSPNASMARTAVRLLDRRQLQESLAWAPQMSLRIALIAGLQASVAVATALVLTLLSPWPELVGFPALGALAALFGRFAPLPRRRRLVAVCALLLMVAVLLPSLASLLGASEWALVLVLALVAGGSTVAVSRWNLGGPGAVIIVFAAGASLHPVASGQELAARMLATAAGGLIGWLVCALSDGLRAEQLRQLQFPVVRIPPVSHQWIAGARIAVGAAIAALLAWAAGAQHPAWAAIGATAVMQGGHLHVTMSRALQRMAGTMIGAVVAWLFLAQHPPLWAIVLAVVLFQFMTEVIIGFNYALGQMTVTPMALLMTMLASHAPLGSMPVERVIDTVLGAAVGIVLAVLFSSADDRVHLAQLRRKSG